VRKSGWALKAVKNQTEEICIEAVKQDAWAVRHITDDSMIQRLREKLRMKT
jgi:hypothetical protein